MTPIQAFETIIAPRLPRHRHPWSTVELGLTEEHFAQLFEVFREISSYQWEAIQEGARDERNRANLLLVIVLVEHARRNTRGSQIWSCMRSLSMHESLRHKFFIYNGQSSSALRRAVEAGAISWNLRNVFNIPGHMAWFVTLFLQFGFSLQAAKRRLPFWLSGQIQPVAVGYLLGGALQCPLFTLAWQSLKAYRQNQMPRDLCQTRLAHSPWIEPAWIPDLLEAARMRLDLMDHVGKEEPDEIEPLILGDPQLVWPPGDEPVFRCEILAATTFDLEEPCYEIRSEAFSSVRIIAREDGLHQVMGRPHVDIQLGAAAVQCTLMSLSPKAGEEEIGTQSVALWERNLPITLYCRSNGAKMLDPNQPIKLNEGSFAVHHRAFSIQPDPVRRHTLGPWRFVELPPCREAELALNEEGERAWWPDEPLGRAEIGDTPQVSVVPIQNRPVSWNAARHQPEVAWRISLPNGAVFRWARIGHEVLDCTADGPNRFRSAPFTLRPEHAVHPLYATVGLAVNGRTQRVSQRVKIDLLGCFFEHEARLRAFDTSKALNARNAGKFVFHIRTPDQQHGEEVRNDWILEGTRIVKKVPARGFQIKDFAGYGEHLALYRGLYNAYNQIAVLSPRVRDNGCVQTVLFNERGFTLKTTSPIELDDDHELIAWTADHQFIRIPSCNLQAQDEPPTWFCGFDALRSHEGDTPSIGAMVFLYRGRRLGNWFAERFQYAIRRIQDDEQAVRCAEMLRWFKAPILDEDLYSSMSYLLHSFLGEVMSVWLGTEASPELGLDPLAEDDEWLRVVSWLVRKAGIRNFDLNAASVMVEGVDSSFNPNRLSESLPRVLEQIEGVSAKLIAKTVHVYLDAISRGDLPGERAAVLQAARACFAVDQGEFEKLCGDLNVDPFFVRRGFARYVSDVQNLSPQEHHNVELLLNQRLMRRYLASLYLGRIKG